MSWWGASPTVDVAAKPPAGAQLEPIPSASSASDVSGAAKTIEAQLEPIVARLEARVIAACERLENVMPATPTPTPTPRGRAVTTDGLGESPRSLASPPSVRSNNSKAPPEGAAAPRGLAEFEDFGDLDLALSSVRKKQLKAERSTGRRSMKSMLNRQTTMQQFALQRAYSLDGKELPPVGGVARVRYHARKWLCPPPVLHPASRLRTCWDVLVIVLVLVAAIATPLEVAFIKQIKERDGGGAEAIEALQIASDAIFLFDLAVNFRTGYIRDGLLIRDSWLVARHYLGGYFAVDFIASFPLIYCIPDGNDAARLNRMLRLLRLAKLMKLLRAADLFKNLSNWTAFNPGLLRLGVLVFGVLWTAHLMGCLWYFIFVILRQQDGMLCENGLLCEGGCAADGIADDACSAPEYPTPEVLAAGTIEEKWLYAFLWAIGIITSYAPFDLRATRPVESIFVCAALLVGMLINAAIISSTTSAISNFDQMATHHKTKLARVEHYLRFHGVKSELSHKILEYYRYLCISSQSLEDLRTFRDLPPQLWLHLSIDINRPLIVKCPLFHPLDNNSILLVLKRLQPLIFPPNQCVLRRDQPSSAMFFVSRGALTEVDEHGAVCRHFVDHDFFGESGLMGDGAALPEHTVQTTSYACLMALTHADFAHVLRQAGFDKATEKFFKMSGLRKKADDAASSGVRSSGLRSSAAQSDRTTSFAPCGGRGSQKSLTTAADDGGGEPTTAVRPSRRQSTALAAEERRDDLNSRSSAIFESSKRLVALDPAASASGGAAAAAAGGGASCWIERARSFHPQAEAQVDVSARISEGSGDDDEGDGGEGGAAAGASPHTPSFSAV